MSNYEDVYPTGRAIQPAAANRIKEAVRKQGHKLMHTEQLLTEAYQLFRDLTGDNGWVAKCENQGKSVALQHMGRIVCHVTRSHEPGTVYVGNDTKHDYLHGSTFRIDCTEKMLDQIQDFIVRYCAEKGIKEL